MVIVVISVYVVLYGSHVCMCVCVCVLWATLVGGCLGLVGFHSWL